MLSATYNISLNIIINQETEQN